jgi:predicted PurR-regulated permease PerM
MEVPSEVKISISTGTVVRVLTIVALGAALWFLRGLALLVVASIVIASAIEPGVIALIRRGVPRGIAVLALYIAVLGGLFTLVYLFLPTLASETQHFLTALPTELKTLNIPAPLTGVPGLNGAPVDVNSIISSIFSVNDTTAETSQGALYALSKFFGGVFSFVIIVVLSFYFAIQETGVESFLRVVTPHDHEKYVVGLWLRAKRKIGLWMQGQLISSALGGIIVYLCLLILGVPYALLLSLITAFAMLIPIFGSIIAAVPPLLVAFSTGGLPMMSFVLGVFVIVNQLEAHLIHPVVVNKVVGVPPILVIIALIAGAELGGFLGALLAVPTAAALREFIDDLESRKRARAS